MTRRRITDRDKLLGCKVGIRFSKEDYNRLSVLLSKSNCRTMGELVRRITLRHKIMVGVRDASQDLALEHLVTLREELNAIGRNINQVTRAFHQAGTPAQEVARSMDLLTQLRKAETPMKQILQLVDQLSAHWLNDAWDKHTVKAFLHELAGNDKKSLT